ncbi:MAG: DUF1292 domain-containing protein [Acutalibacteraceae bacterium]|nr:DUF1292 domain-containing protein [Acutalibacteraceae bacterium]
MKDDTMILYDEDGNGVRFEFLDYMEYEGQKYVALLPLEGEAAGSEVLIMRVEEEASGDQKFDVIGDKKLMKKLYGIFKKEHAEDFDFRD